MIQNDFKYLFATSVNCSDHKISPFIYKMDKIYPFLGRGFHTPVEWKIGYKVINTQTSARILIVNTAFYIYGNIRVKEISILNSFEQIQENTITGSAFSARQLGRGFHTRPTEADIKWGKRCEICQNLSAPILASYFTVVYIKYIFFSPCCV